MKSGLKFTHIIVAILLSTLLCGCNETESKLWQGYVEGEFVYVSSPLGGQLDEISVRKGQTVVTGQPLFTLEREFEKSGVDEAEGNLDRTISDLADKRKGRRPSEIASIKARLRKAVAAERLAATEYKRRADLYSTRTISEEERDQARTDYEQATQLVKEIKSELKTATLGSRTDEINAAESSVRAAQAKLEQARWNYDQKAQSAPRSGLVFDTIRYEGEWVAAGKPIISILPPENRKVRFYVPEQIVGSFKIGEKLLVNFDGLAKPIPVTLSYISAQAEYTPPVIYSSQSRAKLVFMLEAVPAEDKAVLFKPGQPVDVSRTAGGFKIDNGFFARIKNYFRSSDD
ncbi:HlyD family secretion protein [Maridesulfovibrio salexigens]|uniref:Secretion protein HlyD family protein n=1 Tax=Maridesulfovibrio salexigens (strain ATCC 14822 / DSM 2638 / NCIMB 8403 / VKM B-1763) TaxID=526222 RepID=C6BX91_MARSD|nr:HlyD family efflux transporter periplasmic adaptor subunit [Maridesulfovibrio salexigens]ACS80397.1 secretion protein HlyD family protein [Maridesulfovibrio salexigens DSM 2638]